MMIGLVTSTRFSKLLRAAFLKGLRANGWEGDPGSDAGNNSRVFVLSYEAEGGYDDGDGGANRRQELYNAISAFDGDDEVGLIVAVGGLVSAHAAWKKISNTPFLALFGTPPSFNIGSNAQYRGGVNLDLIVKDKDRNAEVCSLYGITDPKKVCLIWNSKSKMGKPERDNWVTTNHWPMAESASRNDDGSIDTAFANAKSGGALGVVVSGDPFFTSRMDALVRAANSSGLKVCYPFNIYKKATPPPTSGSAVIVGPDLENAYETVGTMAANILTAASLGGAAPSQGLIVAPTGNPQPLGKPVRIKPKPKPKGAKKTYPAKKAKGPKKPKKRK